MSKDGSINDLLNKLEETVKWFQDRVEVDLDEGTKRAKEGAVLVKALKEKLKKIENDFKEIKKDLDVDNN